MNIAMISEHANPLATLGGIDAGGQNVHVAALSAALAKLGHRITVYTRRDAIDLPQRAILAPGVTVEHVDAGPPRMLPKDDLLPFMPEFAAKLARAWRQDAPDVAHAHFWMSGIATVTAARPLGIPVVQTFHALGSEKRRHQGSADSSPEDRIAYEMSIARDADRIIATASSEMFELVRLGAQSRALKVVPCGVDLEHFTPDGPVESRRSAAVRIVTLSRLVPRKGVADVIAALASIPGAELVIGGGGESADLQADPEAERLVALARAAGVGNRVRLRGRVSRSELPAFLRSADIVACTPWYEPFGIVPLEAMACGVPVVVSAVGGLIDTVIDGVNGMHAPPRDPAGLARVLGTLCADADHRRRLGRAGLARVRARYAWSRVASETLEVYRSLTGARRSKTTQGVDVS